jgi:chromosome segregation protein
VLGEREGALARETELQADLAARHQAADRRIEEARKSRARHEAEAEKAGNAARDGVERLAALSRDVEAAGVALQEATDLAARAEETLAETETARAEAESREAETRKARADAEGRARRWPRRCVPHPSAGAGAGAPEGHRRGCDVPPGTRPPWAPRSPTT